MPETTRAVLRIALTGGIATGKSYVRRRFETLGVPTIDADALAREVVRPGTAGLAAIVGRFGPGILQNDGTLDRPALASIVFADEIARRDLERIVHPAVRGAIARWQEDLAARPAGRRPPYSLADIPLLYETGREGDFDLVIVAACGAETQVERVMTRDGASEAAARARLAAQLPIDDKARRADIVIRTDGTFADTDRQIADAHARLLTLARARH